jgi:hypothetical protein
MAPKNGEQPQAVSVEFALYDKAFSEQSGRLRNASRNATEREKVLRESLLARGKVVGVDVAGFVARMSSDTVINNGKVRMDDIVVSVDSPYDVKYLLSLSYKKDGENKLTRPSWLVSASRTQEGDSVLALSALNGEQLLSSYTIKYKVDQDDVFQVAVFSIQASEDAKEKQKKLSGSLTENIQYKLGVVEGLFKVIRLSVLKTMEQTEKQLNAKYEPSSVASGL